MLCSSDLLLVFLDRLGEIKPDLLYLLSDLSLSLFAYVLLTAQLRDLSLCISASVLDRVLIGTRTRTYSLTLEVYASGGDVIQLDDGTTGRGLTTSGLTNKAEYFTLLNIKGNIIYCL